MMSLQSLKSSYTDERKKTIKLDQILNALTAIILAVDEFGFIRYINSAGEQFLENSANNIVGGKLDSILPEDSPVFAVISQTRKYQQAVSEYGITIETPRIGRHLVNLHTAVSLEDSHTVIITLFPRSIADKIDRHLSHQGSARSVNAMASLLAHEVKNPLSSIRGAAQLLEDNIDAEGQQLTKLIRDEVDRICALVDRMGLFSPDAIVRHEEVNIHQVLDHVHQLARTGFSKGVRILTKFDPSLPSVRGDRDQLVQVFLNLLKNAVEAVSYENGEVILESAYSQGFRISSPGSAERVQLPLMISVIDNGPGVTEELQPYLFDPFVTNKPHGSGLGLALVAQIVQGHGGIIEYECEQNRTVFKVLLPVFVEEDKA